MSMNVAPHIAHAWPAVAAVDGAAAELPAELPLSARSRLSIRSSSSIDALPASLPVSTTLPSSPIEGIGGSDFMS